MKDYPRILLEIDWSFRITLERFRADSLFQRDEGIYTDDDKKRIALHWREILVTFHSLKRLMRGLSCRSLFSRKKEVFVLRYSAVTTYYSMVCELQESFGVHEAFIRQYLDEQFRENYSTLARYMYRWSFYSFLIYPREFFLTLRDEVSPELDPLFDRPIHAVSDLDRRIMHDGVNIWYYIRFRILILLSWLTKYIGTILARIHITRRMHWLIFRDHGEVLLSTMQSWDVLVTRRNWVATNIGIPWFWKHMTMYIGTWGFIRDHFHTANLPSLDPDTHYVIEAVGDGVRIIPFFSLLLENDYLWVLRPRLTEAKKISAIGKTLSLLGRGYDYSFNYYSEVNYVCSTLVTKAYLPESDTDEWIHITLTRIGTGITYPPNDIVKKFREENATERQELDFVGFIDSSEKWQENFISTQSEFLATATRPRLSFFLP